jgi:hypothetical protein
MHPALAVCAAALNDDVCKLWLECHAHGAQGIQHLVPAHTALLHMQIGRSPAAHAGRSWPCCTRLWSMCLPSLRVLHATPSHVRSAHWLLVPADSCMTPESFISPMSWQPHRCQRFSGIKQEASGCLDGIWESKRTRNTLTHLLKNSCVVATHNNSAVGTQHNSSSVCVCGGCAKWLRAAGHACRLQRP